MKQCCVIQPAVYIECLGDLGGPIAPFPGAALMPPGSDNLQAIGRQDGPQQNRCRKAIGTTYTIQHPVHTVGEVYIRETRWTVHHLSPFRPANMGMTRKVFLTTISFSLYDDPGDGGSALFSDQAATNKITGNINHLAVKKTLIQNGFKNYHSFSY